MFWLVILTLILIGFAFLLLEILVIPGVGVAGIIGFILIGIGIWLSYDYYNAYTGHWILAGTIAGTFFAIAWSLRAKTWRRVALNSEITGKVNLIDEDILKPGDTGISISRLVPGGKAKFNDEYYEVRSMGEFIDPQQEIIIEKIEDHKIFIKPKK